MKYFQSFIEGIKPLFNSTLPGMEAQYLMAPPGRRKLALFPDENTNHKKSSVMLLLYPSVNENKVKILLLLRQNYEGAHSNQVSLPGGKVDEDDKDYLHTALRETYEEAGIPISHINVLGQLTELYIPVSNFLVYPFVGYIDKAFDVNINQREIASVVDFDTGMLFDPMLRSTKKVNPANGIVFETPCFLTTPVVIWGATAMILSEFAEMIKVHRL